MSHTSLPSSPLLNAKEAAPLLGVTKSTLYDWIQRGYIPHYRMGRLVRISAADLEEFIRSTRMNDLATPAIRDAQKELGFNLEA